MFIFKHENNSKNIVKNDENKAYRMMNMKKHLHEVSILINRIKL